MSPKQKALAYTAAYVLGSLAAGVVVIAMDYFLGTLITGIIVSAVIVAYIASFVYNIKLIQYQSEEK